jgi:hypothetical protein
LQAAILKAAEGDDGAGRLRQGGRRPEDQAAQAVAPREHRVDQTEVGQRRQFRDDED